MAAICSICQEKLQSGRAVVLSHCGHVLCDGCLFQWASRNNPPNRVECPMCRKKHGYPKHTAKLYFEEEKSESEMFRSEIRSTMRLLEECVEGPSGSSLARVVNELKNLSNSGKKLGDQCVTAASINGLDAMVNHLSKKLTPIQSMEKLQSDLDEVSQQLEESIMENSRLASQCAASQSRIENLASDLAAEKRSRDELLQERNRLAEGNRSLQEQLSRQLKKNATLQQELSASEERRESGCEKILLLKRKVKHLTEANESLTLKHNLALSGRGPSIPPPNHSAAAHSAPRLSRRGSIISIRSQSSPDTKHVTLVSSDDGHHPPSESSSVEFISDTENTHGDPMPRFRELKLKPVKPPTALFQRTPQASSSKIPPSKSVQKRKLVAALPTAGLELRNGKLTGLVVTGPKRSKRC